MKTPSRFSDKRTQIYYFGDQFLVVCPRCDKKAEVLIKVETQQDKLALFFLPRKWIQNAKNRNEVLKCIAKLRNKLSE